jgi:hypothetical protein
LVKISQGFSEAKTWKPKTRLRRSTFWHRSATQ